MTDNHTLTAADRARIEQEARRIASEVLGIPAKDISPDDTIIYGATKVAEYATIYERQQQAKNAELKSIDNPAHHVKVLKERIAYVEAERTELRNKVIEECIEKIKSDLPEDCDLDDPVFSLAYLDNALNSLKTK